MGGLIAAGRALQATGRKLAACAGSVCCGPVSPCGNHCCEIVTQTWRRCGYPTVAPGTSEWAVSGSIQASFIHEVRPSGVNTGPTELSSGTIVLPLAHTVQFPILSNQCATRLVEFIAPPFGPYQHVLRVVVSWGGTNIVQALSPTPMLNSFVWFENETGIPGNTTITRGLRVDIFFRANASSELRTEHRMQIETEQTPGPDGFSPTAPPHPPFYRLWRANQPGSGFGTGGPNRVTTFSGTVSPQGACINRILGAGVVSDVTWNDGNSGGGTRGRYNLTLDTIDVTTNIGRCCNAPPPPPPPPGGLGNPLGASTGQTTGGLIGP